METLNPNSRRPHTQTQHSLSHHTHTHSATHSLSQNRNNSHDTSTTLTDSHYLIVVCITQASSVVAAYVEARVSVDVVHQGSGSARCPSRRSALRLPRRSSHRCYCRGAAVTHLIAAPFYSSSSSSPARLLRFTSSLPSLDRQ
ncbi:hypothetical protein PIB30_010631 [Stylosanthes scabra]|uniref:Uncharacterized protein n=1 Tax=Stylosanthes scabra TaxID=79078 RepID=A0ABU6U490_9FABA|nr:hypothetical protein [Stylosanthes scabra]